jgi:hypothetical protein
MDNELAPIRKIAASHLHMHTNRLFRQPGGPHVVPTL